MQPRQERTRLRVRSLTALTKAAIRAIPAIAGNFGVVTKILAQPIPAFVGFPESGRRASGRLAPARFGFGAGEGHERSRIVILVGVGPVMIGSARFLFRRAFPGRMQIAAGIGRLHAVGSGGWAGRAGVTSDSAIALGFGDLSSGLSFVLCHNRSFHRYRPTEPKELQTGICRNAKSKNSAHGGFGDDEVTAAGVEERVTPEGESGIRAGVTEGQADDHGDIQRTQPFGENILERLAGFASAFSGGVLATGA